MTATAYCEDFNLYDEHDEPINGPHFTCSICGADVEDRPCPEHAPLTAPPGLRLAECNALPNHYVFVHDRDDYGYPCPECRCAAYVQREMEANQCQHWPWRRWKITGRLLGWAASAGLIAGYSVTFGMDGHDGCRGRVSWRGKRHSILGADREIWRCWRAGHRRGVHIALGYCGKCLPWPCCGSTGEDHADGCEQELAW